MNKVRRRTEVSAEKRATATVMREWLQDKIAAAQKRKSDERKLIEQSEPEGGGHGVTVAMRNIRRPEPKWIVRHEHMPVRHRPGQNVPHVNPLRDLKPKRWWHLRPERQIELAVQLAAFRAKRDARRGGSDAS